jgi:hypothetical protein
MKKETKRKFSPEFKAHSRKTRECKNDGVDG